MFQMIIIQNTGAMNATSYSGNSKLALKRPLVFNIEIIELYKAKITACVSVMTFEILIML